MDRRTRICVAIIFVGLANFLLYTVLYVHIYGEAVNGRVLVDAAGQKQYFLQSGRRVAGWVFVYSGLHSISIWPTVGAVMLAMLTLAKDRIIADMRSAILRGRTIITILATVITLISILMTVWFSLQFATKLLNPQPAGQAVTTQISAFSCP